MACFVSTASVRCVKCVSSGRSNCDVDSPATNGDNGLQVDVNSLRRDGGLRSDTTFTAINTVKTREGNSKPSLKIGLKTKKTSELAAIFSASDSVIKQERQPSVETTPNDKPETPLLNSLKRRRGESITTAEAANKIGQRITPAESSFAQSPALPTAPTGSPSPNEQSSSRPDSPSPSKPRMSIDANKQNNTILWISIPYSSDAVPIKLRSCMTIKSLFDSVLRICDMGEQQQARLSGLRTTLDWQQNVDVKKTLMVKRDFEESFEVFLEIIDASPCWEEGNGRCFVAVEVVMA